MTIYTHEGLRVDLVDNAALAIYTEDVFRLEMTLEEWFAVSRAIPTREVINFDVFGSAPL